MKLLSLILAGSLAAASAFAQLDPALLQQAGNWKSGETPPARLLKFPDGKLDQPWVCGMRATGSEVGDYIAQIKNTELLSALILDYRAQPETVHAAVTQLITLDGTTNVARLLASHPQESTRTELAVLAQLLRFPYAAIQVARIAGDNMDLTTAERVLTGMCADLNAGISWADAYRKTADQNPDLNDRAKDPRSCRTLVSYLYDGVVSPSGFDILNYRVAADLRPVHLQEVFRAKRGTVILKTEGAVYLYHIRQCYEAAD